MSATRNFWSAADIDRLRVWYIEQQLTAGPIAKRLGIAKTRVQRKISTLGLAAQRDAAARHRDLCEAAYAGRQKARAARGEFVWTAASVAELIRLYVDEDQPSAVIASHLGTTSRKVRRKVTLLGLAKARKAKGLRRRRVRKLSTAESVTRLPPGYAAGITAWEMQLKAAPPPVPVDPRAVVARQRAARKTALYHAAKGAA